MNNLDKNTIAKNLSEMIQVNTIKTDDMSQYEIFQNLLEELYPTIHAKGEKVIIAGSLLIKIKGKNSNLKPMLLMSHTDVVEADGVWKHSPFSGDIADDCVWGRGTVDTKGALCAFLEATEDLLKEGFVPESDLYLASSIDEETLGVGAKKTVEYLKSKGVKLGIVLDEGGAIIESPMPGLTGYYAMLGIMEKGYANVEFIAKSLGGHASTPTNNTPIARLASFVNDVNTKSPFKKELTKPVKDMFKEMSKYMANPYKSLFGNVELLSPILKSVLPKVSSQANAMLTTTCAFTMASGSKAPNIIPETASVTANMRVMVHQPLQESLKIIKNVAKKYDIEMKVLYSHDCSKVTDVKSDGYKYICNCITNTFEDVKPVPFIVLAGTDARHYNEICDCVVRFAPLRLNKQQLNSPHGLDENISIDALYGASKFYRYFIENYKGVNI
ncbi:M20/M25/M40 family metallo-hydrolase [Clostridium disporicum]|uniref:Acetylornithine deacetylase/succinyldiaminopimelate desuccinylase-like deacylase n=1 Tax=Clostridium disporicum TaxID=84024 RepID=A0A173XJZ1_9CLOT|nr:M20/M25/M40 family metallo-hydrolase [Clostridium disporicum]CUN51346.1 acetylornithine deacetylase/succinyldiaminopimelate desuccinylase-like deacylase [Clostridium disporicum]